MAVTITVGPKKSTLEGRIDGALMDIIREMPGFKRWKDRVLHFESSAGNLRHLKKSLPDATWTDLEKRLKAIEDEEKREQKLRADKVKKLPPEAGRAFPFRRKPYKHQLKAFHMYRTQPYFGLLFDMGTGKSKTTTDIVADKYRRGEIDCWLIIAWPSSVHRQWVEEVFIDHMPEFVDYVTDWYSPGKRKRIEASKALFKGDGKLRILTINIEAMSYKSSQEVALRFVNSGHCHVTIDESFTIKTPGSDRTRFVMKLRDASVSRNILTGTPIPEGLEDLYSQMLFLSPDILGFNSFYTFRNRYCEVVPAYRGAPQGAVKIIGYRNVKELWDKIDAYCYRVLESECLDLPKQRWVTRYVDLTDEQRRIYNELADKMSFGIKVGGGQVKADEAIVRMMRMQQVISGHVPVSKHDMESDDENVESVRVPSNMPGETVAIWEEHKRRQMVVWARFHKDLDILEEVFEAAGAKTARYDGTVAPKQRAINKKRFVAGEADIFLGNPASGGTGVDGLQCCQLVVYYSNSPKAIDRQQSERRTHRAGMTGSCLYIDLVVRKTVSEKWLALLKEKKDVSTAFLDEPDGWKRLATKIMKE